MSTVRSTDGTTIAYDRYGEGPPVILVSGAFWDRTTPRVLAGLLGSDLAVYAYDRRGRGGSGDTAPYAVERELEDLDAMITGAGGAACVYGHSSGAILALEGAAQGLAVSRLAVYEPPYIVDDTRTRPEGLAERVGALIGSGRRSEAMRLFLAEGPQVPPALIGAIESSPRWPAMEAMAHTLPYDLAVCGDQVLPRDRLARIGAPTLALSGGASPQWAQNAVDEVAATIPGVLRVSLDGQTHAVADQVLAPVLTQFFLSS